MQDMQDNTRRAIKYNHAPHLEQKVLLGAHVGVEDDDELRPGDEVGRVVGLLLFEF